MIGALGGLIGTAFCYAIREATQLRGAYPWLLYFLPAGGLLIVWLYRLRGMHPTDTNGVLLAIHAPTSIPGSTAPLIFVGTTITHLFGGSAGREGAALQLGGVLGYQLGRALKLDEKDIHLIVMCGMSSVFSALFGSPLTAAVFAIEVASVGILHFSAILPCLTASLTAAYLASALGAAAETFPLGAAVPFTWASAGTVVAIAAVCAVLSIVYCIALRQGGKALGKAVPNSYLRVFLGGSAVVLLSVLLGTRDYNGAGMDVIAAAMQGHARPEAFALKMLFTVLTMTTGYKGGEIVPAMFIGATAGCVLGNLFGLAPGLGAAVGLLGMFCGSLNCPDQRHFPRRGDVRRGKHPVLCHRRRHQLHALGKLRPLQGAEDRLFQDPRRIYQPLYRLSRDRPKMEIQRINSYDDARFAKKRSLPAWTFSDGKPCEVEIVSDFEAIVRGENPHAYQKAIEEFRFYAPHITTFYDSHKSILLALPQTERRRSLSGRYPAVAIFRR